MSTAMEETQQLDVFMHSSLRSGLWGWGGRDWPYSLRSDNPSLWQVPESHALSTLLLVPIQAEIQDWSSISNSLVSQHLPFS